MSRMFMGSPGGRSALWIKTLNYGSVEFQVG
jgi:hypothetical protein